MTIAPPEVCPACTTTTLVDRTCPTCRGEALSPAELGALAERHGVSAATLRDVVTAGDPSPLVCTTCAAPMKRARLVDAAFDACAKCGAAFVAAGTRQTLLTGERERERVQPVPTPASGKMGKREIDDGPIGRALGRLGLDASLDATWRIAAAPIVALLFASALAQLVLTGPLFSAAPWLVFSVLAPAPSALLARTIAPQVRWMAWVVAVAVAGLALAAGAASGASAAGAAGAALVGVVLAATMLVSPRRRPSWGSVAVAGVGVALAVVGVIKLKEAWSARRSQGCPPGATWSERAGRICLLPDGTRHGPGELVGSSGHVLERGTWRNGVRDGAFVFFHDDGSKRAEGLFVNDEESGPWLFYRQGSGATNSLEESGRFVNGKREGEWLVYDDEGKKSGSAWYAGGLKVERD